MNGNTWKKYYLTIKNIITKALNLETENKIKNAKLFIKWNRKTK